MYNFRNLSYSNVMNSFHIYHNLEVCLKIFLKHIVYTYTCTSNRVIKKFLSSISNLKIKSIKSTNQIA